MLKLLLLILLIIPINANASSIKQKPEKPEVPEKVLSCKELANINRIAKKEMSVSSRKLVTCQSAINLDVCIIFEVPLLYWIAVESGSKDSLEKKNCPEKHNLDLEI